MRVPSFVAVAIGSTLLCCGGAPATELGVTAVSYAGAHVSFGSADVTLDSTGSARTAATPQFQSLPLSATVAHAGMTARFEMVCLPQVQPSNIESIDIALRRRAADGSCVLIPTAIVANQRMWRPSYMTAGEFDDAPCGPWASGH